LTSKKKTRNTTYTHDQVIPHHNSYGVTTGVIFYYYLGSKRSFGTSRWRVIAVSTRQKNNWSYHHKITSANEHLLTDDRACSGAWYSRPIGDTPAAINARLNYKPLSFFQTDIDLSGTVKPETHPSIVESSFIPDLQGSNTEAMAYLTVYPFQGFDNVTESQLENLLSSIKKVLATQRSMFLRYAPEVYVNPSLCFIQFFFFFFFALV
jgi:hypothetical protein